MATIGLYFLTVGDKLEINKGDILVAISALCYAVHITMMGKYSRRFSAIPLSIVQLGAVACYSALAACFESSAQMNAHYEPLIVQLSHWNVIGAILYSGIFASAFAYYVQTASQRLLEPDKVALTFALEPIIAHVAAFIFLAEHIGVKGWLGCCLIIAGMLYSELGTKRVTKMRALDQVASS
ncbi:DMT family transporter [Thalassotalea sp. ND16A]|uniref:DMT family transporter n=1 Tax=Thalassotalea sp. ND16A TaxID=1535422 RepID=UPI00051D4337|nr:DMT family transporter [Thalassotalea sp. ND16A]KGJ98550.1 hypothetical protein ND16A_0620 [Thalassotalea sp. ND16A]